MDVFDGDGVPARRRGRRPAKPEGRKGGDRVKMTLVVSAEAAERITVHAHKLGLSKAALVDRLAVEHLRRYVVSDRERKPDPGAAGTAA